MPEGEPREEEYYQETVALGRTLVGEQHMPLYLALHRAQERFTSREIVPVTRTPDPVHYFHAKPFLIEPDIQLTVALHPHPSPAGAVGAVAGAETVGVRRREIGQAQAWHYPADNLILLWECFLEDRYREVDPLGDFALQALWAGFERTLIERSPGAERIVTTWEDDYDRATWQRFLAGFGYRQVDKAAFEKPIAP